MTKSNGIAIICATEAHLSAVLRSVQNTRREHFGLFAGATGAIDGVPVAIAVSGIGEGPAYAAARQMAYLFKPKVLMGLGNATAVCENLQMGDLVLASSSQRCYAPVVVTDEMFDSDELLFSSEEMKMRVLGAPVVSADSRLTQLAVEALTNAPPARSRQRVFRMVTAGCMENVVPAWRGAEFLRTRWCVDVVDTESYGFLSAASDCGVPSVCLRTAVAAPCGPRAMSSGEQRYCYLVAVEGLRSMLTAVLD